MTSKELRKAFLEFFEKKGHKITKPTSLVPDDDKSVLFNVAGMQQFKPYYNFAKDPIKDIHPGLQEPLGSNLITTAQPCIRTVDIEEVGNERHLTMFEMLGNFSFNGTYFKKEAIDFAFEYISDVLKLDWKDIYVTVFEGDENVPFDQESHDLWKAKGISEDKIKKCSKEDNFWGPVGAEGVCGPCSEIHFKGIEIWNLVFVQYYKKADGTLEKLEKVGVDTGGGLERQLVAANNGSNNVYETDIFADQIKMLQQKASMFDLKSAKIIADHFRASVFLIANGIIPSNIERGYVLRRLIRRTMRRLKQIGIDENIFDKMLINLQDTFGQYYPEIMDTQNILDVLNKEINKFNLTLENGLKELNILFENNKDEKIDAKQSFYIYETFGFPIEMIKEEAEGRGFTVDEAGFASEFETHKEISRAGLEGKFGGHNLSSLDVNSDSYKIRTRLHTSTHLLLKALREVLGDDVFQKGSDINDERLRFDFTFTRKMTEEELLKVENIVNQKIKEEMEVEFQEMDTNEALRKGYLGSFMSKYPEKVTVYKIGEWSKEICAGPHVANIKELGKLKIVKEEASSQGVRRIKAVLTE